LGWSASRTIRFEDFISRVHPEDRSRIRQTIDDAINNGKDYDSEYRLVLPDGIVRWMATRATVHFDENGKPARLLGITIDMTARKQAELEAKQRRDDLSHLSRVTLMGEMAASLAHELNQPLSGIVSNASAGQRFIAQGNVDLKEIREIFADISADGRRAGEVVRGIRTMVKKGEMRRERIDLNKIVMNVVQIVGADALLNSCELRTRLETDSPFVEADAVQLQQVLLNLIVNSFDAMRDVPAGQRKVEITTQRNGNGTVEIIVRDYGTGISDDANRRLFEQFFTTKTEGLGMGLAIARSIVESHGGMIGAENVDGGGARFRFTLPLTAAA
jgi:two-component system, LuxR family, sensor kinase FixL